MDSSRTLHLRLFGSPIVAGEDGTLLTGGVAQRHRLALLALLGLAPDGGLSRDKVMAALWPERSPDRARNLLNAAVHVARKALGDAALVSDTDRIRLNPDLIRIDVREFEEAVARGRDVEAVELYRAPFLDGFFLSDAPEFERWVDQERQRLADALATAYERLADQATARDDLRDAVKWWKARAAHDPYDSRIALSLMRALVAGGNRAGALQHASVHERLLREELGLEPGSEVVAFAERLRAEPAGRTGPVPAPSAERTDVPATAAEPDPTPATAAVPDPAPARVDTVEPVQGGLAVPRTAAAPRRGPAIRLAGLTGLTAVLVLWGAFWLRQSRIPALHPQRVVVAPFENRTGDPSLDPVATMAADWIAQGLSRTGLVEIVPPGVALASARHVRAGMAAAPGMDPVRALAEETGAGIVVSGAYYQEGDSLLFHTHINDARRRRVLLAMEPVVGSVRAPTGGIELLRRRTIGALASILDARSAVQADLETVPPSFEAYRAISAGIEAFIERRWGESIELLQHAVLLDSTYLPPHLLMGFAHANLGAGLVADSIARALSQVRDQLAPYEQARLDVLRSWSRYDQAERYEAVKRAATLAPDLLLRTQWGIEAARSNRPHEALGILEGIDASQGRLREWGFYWRYLTTAHHMLGSHRRELREARKARALSPDDPLYIALEVRALAALGRVQDVEKAVNARMLISDQRRPATGSLMIIAAHELSAHGHRAAADTMYRRAIAWYHGRPGDEQERQRPVLAHTYMFAGEWEEARARFQQLAFEDPEDIDYQMALGQLAARLGDTAEVDRIADRLERIGPDVLSTRLDFWMRSSAAYGRACIAAQLGRQDEAVSLLQQAFSQAVWYGFHPHTDPCLDPLRDYPPFRELMRPKG